MKFPAFHYRKPASVLMVFALLSSTTRNASFRLAVRAFSTSGVPSRLATRTISPHLAPFSQKLTTRASATVEEDLDAALDDILGEAFFEAEGVEPGIHIEGSKPIPKTLVEEDNPVDLNDPKYLSVTNPHWVEAGLSQKIIDVLSEKGIVRFTQVQAEAFEPVYAGRDVICRSRTGTGKTLAFGLPGLMRLTDLAKKKGLVDERTGRMVRGRKVSMLVLCPTRELARQVKEEIATVVARPLGLFTEVFHGGVSYDGQNRALRNGLDILVGTPGRVIDHLNRGNLDLSGCEIAVLDEADEMLNMGFAEDVEVILEGVGSANEEKTQCLMFSATTPPWVKEIGKQYQTDVLSIDATAEDGGARTATTVRHLAVQLPPGPDSKKAILEDIIAVEISKDTDISNNDIDASENPIAAAAAEKKRKSNNAMQQKIFGKTIVFTETKRDADELVSGGIFKSLTAQALHGDVGQKQRDATLNAFRAGAFNVLVATDVAARGIDIQDVDLVVQFQPPRDPDTYVHRSGRTGRAGKPGTSVLLFSNRESRDIVKIERSLGHGFKFELAGPPSTEAALHAAAKTSALACQGIPDETAEYFKKAASLLLSNADDPEEIVAKCLAAISRRSAAVESRSLLTGELGMATVEMVNSKGRPVSPGDVMFTVSKLSRMSHSDGEINFDNDVGKIQSNGETGAAIFDMGVEDARNLVEYSKSVNAGGAVFSLLKEMEIERGRHFGKSDFNRRGGGGRMSNQRNGYQGRGRDNWGGRGGRDTGRGYRNNNNYHGGNHRSSHEGRNRRDESFRGRDGGRGSGGHSGYRRREDNFQGRRYNGGSQGSNDGW